MSQDLTRCDEFVCRDCGLRGTRNGNLLTLSARRQAPERNAPSVAGNCRALRNAEKHFAAQLFCVLRIRFPICRRQIADERKTHREQRPEAISTCDVCSSCLLRHTTRQRRSTSDVRREGRTCRATSTFAFVGQRRAHRSVLFHSNDSHSWRGSFLAIITSKKSK